MRKQSMEVQNCCMEGKRVTNVCVDVFTCLDSLQRPGRVFHKCKSVSPPEESRLPRKWELEDSEFCRSAKGRFIHQQQAGRIYADSVHTRLAALRTSIHALLICTPASRAVRNSQPASLNWGKERERERQRQTARERELDEINGQQTGQERLQASASQERQQYYPSRHLQVSMRVGPRAAALERRAAQAQRQQ